MAVNLNAGIKAILEKFTSPAIAPELVLRGDQRTAVLPASDEFIIFRTISQRRISKTQSNLIESEEASRYREYVEANVQIDFYGSRAFQRASVFEVLAKSCVIDRALQSYGVDALDTSPIQNLTAVLDDNQLTERWMLTLTVGYCNDVTLPQDYATSVSPALIEINANFKG